MSLNNTNKLIRALHSKCHVINFYKISCMLFSLGHYTQIGRHALSLKGHFLHQLSSSRHCKALHSKWHVHTHFEMSRTVFHHACTLLEKSFRHSFSSTRYYTRNATHALLDLKGHSSTRFIKALRSEWQVIISYSASRDN